MGLLDSLEGMAAHELGGGAEDKATDVSGSLLDVLRQHPGGLGGVLDSFRNNGLGGHADAVQNGDAPPMTPEQAQTGLQGTGILQQVAQRAGVSPQVAAVVASTVLPMVLAHMSQHGEAPSNSMFGSLLSRVL